MLGANLNCILTFATLYEKIRQYVTWNNNDSPDHGSRGNITIFPRIFYNTAQYPLPFIEYNSYWARLRRHPSVLKALIYLSKEFTIH